MEEPIHVNVVQTTTDKAQEAKVVALGAMTFNDALAFVSNDTTVIGRRELAIAA